MNCIDFCKYVINLDVVKISQDFAKNTALSCTQIPYTKLVAWHSNYCEAQKYWIWENKPKGNEDFDGKELNMF